MSFPSESQNKETEGQILQDSGKLRVLLRNYIKSEYGGIIHSERVFLNDRFEFLKFIIPRGTALNKFCERVIYSDINIQLLIQQLVRRMLITVFKYHRKINENQDNKSTNTSKIFENKYLRRHSKFISDGLLSNRKIPHYPILY